MTSLRTARHLWRALVTATVLGSGALATLRITCPMAVVTLATTSASPHHDGPSHGPAHQHPPHRCTCLGACCLMVAAPGQPTGPAAAIAMIGEAGLPPTPAAWLVVPARLLPFATAPPSAQLT
jgi:hypothetical protein